MIYLPEPDFQDLALAGVETLVSTRLDPGLDPIVEADRRGSILAVVRVGNKDMEIPGGSGVSPIATMGRPSQVMQASAMMPARQPSYAPAMQAGYAQPAVSPIPTAPVPMMSPAGGIAQTSYGCDSGGCSDTGCSSCSSGAGAVGGCLNGNCIGSSADFYGPMSTPRGGHGPGGLPPGLAGGGMYGMPITGTPIGLPGPPHVPLGVPAGLQKHVMHNWTSRHIPDPVSKLKINVKQRPGLSYPQPPSRAWVVEDTLHSAPHYSNRNFGIPGGGIMGGGSVQGTGPGVSASCPDGSCGPAVGGGLLSHVKGLLGH